MGDPVDQWIVPAGVAARPIEVDPGAAAAAARHYQMAAAHCAGIQEAAERIQGMDPFGNDDIGNTLRDGYRRAAAACLAGVVTVAGSTVGAGPGEAVEALKDTDRRAAVYLAPAVRVHV